MQIEWKVDWWELEFPVFLNIFCTVMAQSLISLAASSSGAQAQSCYSCHQILVILFADVPWPPTLHMQCSHTGATGCPGNGDGWGELPGLATHPHFPLTFSIFRLQVLSSSPGAPSRHPCRHPELGQTSTPQQSLSSPLFLQVLLQRRNWTWSHWRQPPRGTQVCTSELMS